MKRRAQTAGQGVTQFGSAMCELNIDTFCANSSPAKGRVARSHLTLQDRLVKELRLRGISSTIEARKRPGALLHGGLQRALREAPWMHRPLRADEDLDAILTWRVPRKVSHVLTVLNDRVIWLLDD